MPVFHERKIERTIKDNFEKDDDAILVLEEARQTGKTSVMRRLGRKRYRHFVEIDVAEDGNVSRLFRSIRTAGDLCCTIRSIAGEPLGNYRDALILLDGVQECGHILTLLKFPEEDRRYKFIASGSLLGAELKKTPSIPAGGIRTERMYPMDFEEFLWANGIDKKLFSELRKQIFENERITDGLHKRIMDLFKDYLIWGGLPKCASVLLQTGDIVAAGAEQKNIYEMYGNDAAKCDLENKMHTKTIPDMIPSSIENKRERISAKDIEGRQNARFSEYRDDFENLVDSGVVLMASCCSNPVFPLTDHANAAS